jgi:transcriptional regulator with XRE-family HTH domain
MELLDTEKMKALRLAKGLSQHAAAALAGLRGGRSRWADIETGTRPNITLETLASIAAALECDPADLLATKPPAKRRRV